MKQFIKELSIYPLKGEFDYFNGDLLKEKCVAIPDEPGVYIITSIIKQSESIVYIGASGKVNQDGTFKKQKLKKRVQNMQKSKIRRQDWFNQQIRENEYDKIKVYWWITYDDKNKDLPLFVEAKLLQKFFELHAKLPKWNNQA